MFYAKHNLAGTLLFLTGTMLATFSHPALAETVLERVSRTGELVAGTRTDAQPFAYRENAGDWAGYSIDLLEQIRAQVQQDLRRPVQLKLVAINDASSMIAQINQSQVDLTCGTTSYSSIRDIDVDFSVGYFLTGTKLLIKPTNQLGSEFKVGVIRGTTNQSVIQRHFPIAQFVTFENRAIGLEALSRGQIDALGSDSVLLEALRQSLPEPERQNYEVFPANEVYSPETYACMLPQGDAELKQIVDTALLQFMQNALKGGAEAIAAIEPWFGETGMIPSERPGLFTFFQSQLTHQPLLTQQTLSTTSPQATSPQATSPQ